MHKIIFKKKGEFKLILQTSGHEMNLWEPENTKWGVFEGGNMVIETAPLEC